VDAHLNYVQSHSAVYVAIYRSGMAIAPEVSSILEEHREVVLSYFLKDFGIAKPRPVLRAALRAWIAMFEGACLDWITHQELDRSALRELVIAGHAAMLIKAAEMDPKVARSLEFLLHRGRSSKA
jgi:hypothetical protein